MAGTGTATVIPITPRGLPPGLGKTTADDERSVDERRDIADCWRASRYGEIHQALSGKAAVISAATFGAGVIEPRSGRVVPAFDEDGNLTDAGRDILGEDLADDLASALARITSGPGGLARLIYELTICYDVEGRAVLLGGWVNSDGKPISEPAGTPGLGEWESWRYVADHRVTTETKNGRTVHMLDGVELPRGTVIHRQMVRWPDSGTSGVGWVKAALEPWRDLLVFTLAQRAMARSNVPADILLAPYEANPALRNPAAPPSAQSWSDVLTGIIADSATKALTVANSGGQVVGPVLSVKADYVDKFQRVALSKTPNEVFAALIGQAKRRINEIADEAVENVEGLGATNRWNAQKITEQTWRRWYGPRVREIAESLLRSAALPLLEAIQDPAGVQVYDRDRLSLCAIWVDPSAVVGKPDQATHADAGLKSAAIGHAAWREATGFTADDAPDDDELELILEMASKSTTDDQESSGSDGHGATGDVNELVGSAQPIVQAAAKPDPYETGRIIATAERQFIVEVLAAAGPAAEAVWERLAGRARNEARSMGHDHLGVDVFAALAALDDDTLANVLASSAIVGAGAPGKAMDAFAQAVRQAAGRWWDVVTEAPSLLKHPVLPTKANRDLWAETAGKGAAERLLEFIKLRASNGADELGEVPAGLGRVSLSMVLGEQAPPGTRPDQKTASGPAMSSTLVDMFGNPTALSWWYGTLHRESPFIPHKDLNGEPIPMDGVVPDMASPWGGWWVGDHDGCLCTTLARFDTD